MAGYDVAKAMLRLGNVAVVGILFAALFDPICTCSVTPPVGFAMVIAASV